MPSYSMAFQLFLLISLFLCEQEGYQYLARSGLTGGKAMLLGWNGEDKDGFLEV